MLSARLLPCSTQRLPSVECTASGPKLTSSTTCCATIASSVAAASAIIETDSSSEILSALTPLYLIAARLQGVAALLYPPDAAFGISVLQRKAALVAVENERGAREALLDDDDKNTDSSKESERLS